MKQKALASDKDRLVRRSTAMYAQRGRRENLVWILRFLHIDRQKRERERKRKFLTFRCSWRSYKDHCLHLRVLPLKVPFPQFGGQCHVDIITKDTAEKQVDDPWWKPLLLPLYLPRFELSKQKRSLCQLSEVWHRLLRRVGFSSGSDLIYRSRATV